MVSGGAALLSNGWLHAWRDLVAGAAPPATGADRGTAADARKWLGSLSKRPGSRGHWTGSTDVKRDVSVRGALSFWCAI